MAPNTILKFKNRKSKLAISEKTYRQTERTRWKRVGGQEVACVGSLHSQVLAS